jgi:anthranilate/para-aminobenzoate synthase component I
MIDFDQKELMYGAGGGITLKSEVAQEYEEMIRKAKSYLGAFL